MQFSRFVVRLGHEWALDRHRHCRNGVEDSEALRRVVGRALVAQSETKKRENEKSDFSRRNGACVMEAAALLN